MRNRTYLLCCFAIIMISACIPNSSRYSKKNHRATFDLNDFNKPTGSKHLNGSIKLDAAIYVEKYTTFFGGTTTSDAFSYYITDSIHFRKYVGTKHHGDELMLWQIKSANDITFYLTSRKLTKEGKIVSDTVAIGNYNIPNLIKEGKFE